MNFKDIKFGLIDAEDEKSDCPDLLLHAFFDSNGIIDCIQHENKYLVYGSKGSGKSAIGSRIELLSKGSNEFFAHQYSLKYFDYVKFSELVPTSEVPAIKYRAGWHLILALALLESYRSDEAYADYKRKNIGKIVQILEEIKLLPSKELGQIVKTASSKEFAVSLHFISAKYETEGIKIIDYDALIGAIRNNLLDFIPAKKHYIIIDGLDSIPFNDKKQMCDAISELIFTADDMNKDFRNNKINAKIIVMCRTEILDSITGANINKPKTDYGLNLEWYQGGDVLESTNLYKLVNLRASQSLHKDVDVFEEYFPKEKYAGDINTVKYIFDHTRHTPRDMIQLMNCIQDAVKGQTVTREDIRAGIRSYSRNYFISEIKDEMAIFLKDDEINHALDLLRAIKKTPFSIKELKQIAEIRNLKGLDIEKILTMLYDCSAIGNRSQNGKNTYISFKYRNTSSTIDFGQLIIFHNGLQRGRNL